jgi:hypothetical protein
LTLKEIVSQFTTDVNEFDKEKIERENKVIEDFTDVYLKTLLVVEYMIKKLN